MHIDELGRANHCQRQSPPSLFWYDLIYLIEALGIPSSYSLNDCDSCDGDGGADGIDVEGFVGGKWLDDGDDSEHGVDRSH